MGFTGSTCLFCSGPAENASSLPDSTKHNGTLHLHLILQIWPMLESAVHQSCESSRDSATTDLILNPNPLNLVPQPQTLESKTQKSKSQTFPNLTQRSGKMSRGRAAKIGRTSGWLATRFEVYRGRFEYNFHVLLS